MRDTYKKIVCIVLVIAIVIEAIYFFQGKQNSAQSVVNLSLNTISEQKTILSKKIRVDGGQKTFNSLKTLSVSGGKSADQHSLAHIFGELLFGIEGIKGIGVCDSSFTFGCYHGFFVKAVEAKGLTILPSLEKECMEKFKDGFKACTHGIGHGVLEYTGHTKLVDSLNACDVLQSETTLYGCRSGVLMEFFGPTRTDGKGAPVLSYSIDYAHDPYDECPNLPEKFRPVCYYELTGLWIKMSTPEKMGELCAALSNELERNSCFMGIGNYGGPAVQFVVEKTVRFCEKMPTQEGVTACLREASWSFFGNPLYKKLSPLICKDLSISQQKGCVTQKDI